MKKANMARDFTALQGRMRDVGGAYEKREDPAMGELANTLGKIGEAFEGFKRRSNAELADLRNNVSEQTQSFSEIKRSLDKMETRLSRPGAFSGQHATGDADPDSPVLRTPADFERRYSRAGGSFGGGDDERVPLADFVRGVAGIRTTESVKASLAVGTDTAGGYAVPNRVMGTIFSAMVPESALMQAGVGFIPLEDGAKSVTTAVTETIPVAAWRKELGTVAAADATFRGVVSTPRSIACVVRISRELLADGHGVEDALRLAIAQAFAKEVDRVGLRGSGTAPEPRGLLNTSGVNIVTQGAAGTALASYAPILSGMLAIRNESAPAATSAIMAPRSTFKLGGLTDTTGQPIQKPELIRDIKLIDTPQIPVNLSVGASSDCSEIYLGDFKRMYYLIRENLSIQMLNEKYSDTGEIGLLCHARLDVVVPYPKAFAIVTGVRA